MENDADLYVKVTWNNTSKAHTRVVSSCAPDTKVVADSGSVQSKVERNRLFSQERVLLISVKNKIIKKAKNPWHPQLTYKVSHPLNHVKTITAPQKALVNYGPVLSSRHEALCLDQTKNREQVLFDIQTQSSELDGPQLTKEAPWKK